MYSMPTTVTTATVATFPRKSTKSPTEFIAASLMAFTNIILKASLAALQNP